MGLLQVGVLPLQVDVSRIVKSDLRWRRVRRVVSWFHPIKEGGETKGDTSKRHLATACYRETQLLGHLRAA